MKIRDGFILRTVAGQNVVVPVGENCLNFNAAITLNETAAFLWDCLKEDQTEESLAAKLTEEYDVTYETAKADIGVFLNVLREHEILE